jgi:hypothetical protein
MNRALIAIVLLCLSPILASAQDNHAEVTVGYEFMHLSSGGSGINAPKGIQFDGAVNLNDWFGVEGNFSYNEKSFPGGSASLKTYSGGPRLTYHASKKVSTFGHFLLGGMTADAGFGSSSGGTSAFAWGVGGGVDVALNNWASVRLVQADYMTATKDGGRLNTFRIGPAFVLTF